MNSCFHPANAAEQLLFLLAANGIEHLFLNPGTDSAPLQEAMKTLPAKGIKIPRVHASTFESVSLAAAHAYFQATGRPQCVFVHVDSGTQNLGAIAHDVFRDRAGVVIIAGMTPYGEDGQSLGSRSGYIQWLQDVPDQAGIIRGYAKSVMEITRVEVMDRVVGRAVQLASSYPAGLVYLTISREVLMDPPSPGALRIGGFAVPSAPAIEQSVLKHVAALVCDAEFPLLITSRLGRTAEGFAAVSRLAELAGVTVIRGADTGPLSIPTLHPMHLRSAEATIAAIRRADVILVVESDVPFIPKFVMPNVDAVLVHVDPDPLKASMPLWSFPFEIAVTADGPVAIDQLVTELALLASDSDEIAERFHDRLERAGDGEVLAITKELGEGEWCNESQGILVDDVFFALNEMLRAEDIVIEEAVTNDRLLYQNLIRTLPSTIAGAFAPGLGWALGGAVGMKLARPNQRVIAVCGDGSFLFSVPSSALMMSAEMGCPFLTIILNNGGYRASRLPVYELFPEGVSIAEADAVGTWFTEAPDFASLAEACHASGERVDKIADLLPAIKRGLTAIESGRSAVIDVHVKQN